MKVRIRRSEVGALINGYSLNIVQDNLTKQTKQPAKAFFRTCRFCLRRGCFGEPTGERFFGRPPASRGPPAPAPFPPPPFFLCLRPPPPLPPGHPFNRSRKFPEPPPKPP